MIVGSFLAMIIVDKTGETEVAIVGKSRTQDLELEHAQHLHAGTHC